MNWQELCSNRNLADLPFKMELNEHGQIVMSPTKVLHSLLQGEIGRLLSCHLSSGKAFPECAIHTPKGTKVADVVWVSEARLQIIKHEAECSIAPEICVEVLSDSNTEQHIMDKKQLYFDRQAQEFWLCDQRQNIRFFSPHGELPHSMLVPGFPNRVQI